jgi:Flp pilus assembly protein TadB
MIAAVLGACAFALIVSIAISTRRDRGRTRRLVPARQRESRTGPFAIIGRAIARVPVVSRYAKDEVERANLALTLIVGLMTCIVSIRLAVVVVVLLQVRVFLAMRRKAKARHNAILRELPLVADLLRLCIVGGMNVSHAVNSVARFLDGPIAVELTHVQDAVGSGARLADRLEAVIDALGEDVRPLFGALVSSERYGAPLSGLLERLAFEARRAQEHRAEQAAKRLSVQLLFPVAGTILPAFALLTVAPLLASQIEPLASVFH